MTSLQQAHAPAKFESESAGASNHSPEDNAKFVAVPQAFLPSERLKWQSPRGGRNNGRVFPYGKLRTGDGDFGPATLVDRDGSLLLIHESKRHEGRTFRFELTHETITHKYFKCKDCVEYAHLVGSQGDKAVKSVGVCNGRLLTDPDSPKGKNHICMKQNESAQVKQEHGTAVNTPSRKCSSSAKTESFGRAEYTDDTKSKLVYKSRLYPGKTLRFIRTNRYLNRTYYDCYRCRVVKEAKKLNIRLGTVIVCDDEIVGRDPDIPHGKIGHLCVQAPPYGGASAEQSCEEFVITEDAADDFNELSVGTPLSASDEHAEPGKAIVSNPVPEVAKSDEDLGASGNKHAEHDREHADADSREKGAVTASDSQPNAELEESFEEFLILTDPADGLKELSGEVPVSERDAEVVIGKENAGDAVPLADRRRALEDVFVGEDQFKDDKDVGAGKELVGSGSRENGTPATYLPACSKRSLHAAPKRFGCVIFDDEAEEKIVYYNNGSQGFKFDLVLQNVTAAGIRRTYRCSACFEVSGRTGIGCAVADALDEFFVDVDPAAPNGLPHLCQHRRKVAQELP